MKKSKYVGTAGIFLGIAISKILSTYYDFNGKITVMFSLILIVLFMLLYMIWKKHFLASMFMLIGFLPIIVSFIGMWSGNLYLGIGGILSIFIVVPILIKIMTYFANNKK